jgi:hypothetical protein
VVAVFADLVERADIGMIQKISGSGKIVATITGLTTGIEEKAGRRDDLLNPQRFRPTLPRTWQLNLAPPRISFFFSPFLALEQRDAVSL